MSLKNHEWNKEKTEALVRLYQQNQCLYDPSHYLYRDRSERKKTISYFADVLQTTEYSITSKIKNIRSQLWRERWKEQDRELNGTTDDRTKWWLKDSLQFLEPFLVLKPSTCGLQTEDGQTLPIEVSPESERDLIQASDFSDTNTSRVAYLAGPVDLDESALQVDNTISDQSGFEDVHQYDSQESNQISGEEGHQDVELSNFEEVKIKEDDDEMMQDCSSAENPIQFISNYPTGIFRHDYLLDNRSQKGRYKQVCQRSVESTNEQQARHTLTDGLVQNDPTSVHHSKSVLSNASIKTQLRNKLVSSESHLASASSGSHPDSQQIYSQVRTVARNTNFQNEQNVIRNPRTLCQLRGNSVKRVVEKYKGKADTTRHKKEKLAVRNSFKRSLNDKEFDTWSEGHLVAQAVSCIERVSSRLALEDQFSVFGKHVANELRSVPTLDAQRWARMKIQNILYEAQTLANPSNSTNRPSVEMSLGRHTSANNGTVQSTSTD
ncbi:uncharacterized protein [Antedon mediterranea]|uniref:uncharacterized protein n=1 Tax=Antedon mediterranea TaxID=105859 RepID=UPI003AF7949A